MWAFIQANWHKFLVVIIAVVQGVQYAASKFGSKTKPQQQVTNIQLPEKGCIITIKPLD
jgi:hypothetical protein